MSAVFAGARYVREPSPEGGCNGCAGKDNLNVCAGLPGNCHFDDVLDMIWAQSAADSGDPTDAHPV